MLQSTGWIAAHRFLFAEFVEPPAGSPRTQFDND